MFFLPFLPSGEHKVHFSAFFIRRSYHHTDTVSEPEPFSGISADKRHTRIVNLVIVVVQTGNMD